MCICMYIFDEYYFWTSLSIKNFTRHKYFRKNIHKKTSSRQSKITMTVENTFAWWWAEQGLRDMEQLTREHLAGHITTPQYACLRLAVTKRLRFLLLSTISLFANKYVGTYT